MTVPGFGCNKKKQVSREAWADCTRFSAKPWFPYKTVNFILHLVTV